MAWNGWQERACEQAAAALSTSSVACLLHHGATAAQQQRAHPCNAGVNRSSHALLADHNQPPSRRSPSEPAPGPTLVVQGLAALAHALLAGAQRTEVLNRLGHSGTKQADHDAASGLAVDLHIKVDLPLGECG